VVVRRSWRARNRGLRHLNLQTFLRESTWGYPIIGALHVLGMAWFTGTMVIAGPSPDLRRARLFGAAAVCISGLVLFWLHPAQYSASTAFRLKILALLLLTLTRRASAVSLALWVVVVFASRGIAFF
jgi:hypothetical protein